MELVKPPTLSAFRQLIEPLVLEREAEHGLIYGLSGTSAPPPAAYWAVVTQGGVTVAAALRTIAKTVLSREGRPGAIAMLAQDAMNDPGLRGVLGPPASIQAFASAFGREWRPGSRSTIYECREVVNPRSVSGERRLVRAADRDLLVRWVESFHAEAIADGATRVQAEASADRYIANEAMHFWVNDGTPVACAAAIGATPNGIRIAGVYTPPEHRARGYASALVADLTQSLLTQGKRFTYLYANQANPTSNSIYQKIGYRRVTDSEELWLV